MAAWSGPRRERKLAPMHSSPQPKTWTLIHPVALAARVLSGWRPAYT